MAVIANSAVAAGAVKSFMLQLVQVQRSLSIGSLSLYVSIIQCRGDWIGRLGMIMGEWAGLNTLLPYCMLLISIIWLASPDSLFLKPCAEAELGRGYDDCGKDVCMA